MRKVAAGSMGAFAFVFLLTVTAMTNPVAPDWIRLAYAPARYSHDCAYDTMRHTVVMFGGRDSLGRLAPGVWEWDGANWIFANPLGPSPREGHRLCYDMARNKTILFGGRDSSGIYLNDTWSWDGVAWTLLQVQSPPPRAFFAMEYDPSRQNALLFGGANQDSLFGDTWGWDGAQWSPLAIDGPSPRIYSDMVTPRTLRDCELFGGQAGFDGLLYNDKWGWNGTTWILINPGYGEPVPRWGHSFDGDGWSYFSILYGGWGGSEHDSLLDDSWASYGAGWTNELYLEHAPPGRVLADMVKYNYDYHVLLIGGTNGSRVFGEIWALCPEAPNMYYIPGDINSDWQVNGLDIVFLVNYFKGIGPPPAYYFLYYHCPALGENMYAVADLNGNCAVNGIDVTFGVAYFKGLQPSIRYCPSCPPRHFIAGEPSDHEFGPVRDELMKR